MLSFAGRRDTSSFHLDISAGMKRFFANNEGYMELLTQDLIGQCKHCSTVGFTLLRVVGSQ